MNKKGFTLVELLACVAILAVLVIIAVPKVQSIIDASNKNSFLADAQTIYRTANTYSLEIFGGESGIFSSKGENRLDISRNDYDYCIKINEEGNISLIAVSNGKYFVEGDDKFLSLSDDSVIEGNMDSYICE